tara:strand:+ start:63 stop:272 length:210 start_codon:yes stop_codon:yes gene_type:complete
MGTIKEFLKRLKCKAFVCCGSKCSLNDTDGDGMIDQISWVDDNGNKIVIDDVDEVFEKEKPKPKKSSSV